MRTILAILRQRLGLCCLALMSTSAFAQTTSVYLVDYAKTSRVHQVRLQGVTLLGPTASGSLPRNTVSAGNALRAELVNSDDGSVLASAVLDLAANTRHALLVSGDGNTQPFRLQAVTSAAAEVRVFNAALLPGAASESALSVDWPGAIESLPLAHGAISPILDAGIYGGMRVRRNSNNQTLLQLARFTPDLRGRILVVHGQTDTLWVDAITLSTGSGEVSVGLRQLVSGPVKVQLLNGGAYFFPEDAMSVRLSSALPGGVEPVGSIYAYGELSPAYMLAESGIFRVCAQPRVDGGFLPDTQVCDNVEMDGGKRYVLVSKAFAPDSCCSTLFDDPLPFLVYELTEASSDRARLTLSYAAVAPQLGEAMVVSRDDGSLPQQFRSPFAYEAETGFRDSRVRVLDGAPGTLDLKVRSIGGNRNLADLAPLSVGLGVAIDAFLIGDGKRFPYRIVTTSGTPAERTVNMDVNGFWSIDEIPLEGFNLTPVPSQDRLLGTWFSHNSKGETSWYTFDSCRSEPGASVCAAPTAFAGDSVELRVYRTQSAGSGRILEDAGLMSIHFESCTRAVASISLLGLPNKALRLSNQTPSADCLPEVTLGDQR